MKKILTFVVFGLVLLTSPQKLHAWGERGHHLICAEAARLVQEPNLKNFLKSRGELMGHVCNIPDISWKSLPSSISAIGNPTHYFEPDLLGLDMRQMPTNFEDFKTLIAPQGEVAQLLQQTGTMWWRADQFSRLGIAAGRLVAASAAPINNLEEQLNTLPYNSNIYDMMTAMGLLGHYAGDASMPYHNTGNYDGYSNGHGGIHAYYESVCAAEYTSELAVDVRKRALRIPNSPRVLSVPEVFKTLSVEAYAEIVKVERADVIIQASTLETTAQGMTIRRPAQRPAPEVQCPRFRTLIAQQMARSAKALAYIWDQIYIQSNRPNLSSYRSYRYPLVPDFVPPDYLP